MYEVNHFIAGQVTSSQDRKLEITNPATGQQIGWVSAGSAADVDQAVRSAKTALASWSDTTALNRARILFAFRQLVASRMELLAEEITREHGKTLDDAKGEIIRGMEVVEFACGIPHLLKGDFTQQVGNHVDAYTLSQPLGVVAGITPFNFPAMVPMWMWPIALACGNCFLLKPSEKDPSASLLVAKWLQEAGLPDGVFNVIQGDKDTVDAIISHSDIQAISFVGSTPVARSVYLSACTEGKRVQALGGAKNHLVVMPDADLDAAENALVGAAFGSAGERCMAISVAVAVGAIADELVERLANRTRQLKIGDGRRAGVDMGPLISFAHLQKVSDYIQSGVDAGAELVVDGRSGYETQGENGFFIGGSLFDGVQPEMKIYREEIFGPVLCVVRVPDFASAVELINQNAFANGTSIFTRSGAVARKFSQDIQVGMVGINVPIPVPMAFHSFGGWKQSLFGDYHMYGREGVHFYTRRKAVTARWDEGDIATEFTMPTLK